MTEASGVSFVLLLSQFFPPFVSMHPLTGSSLSPVLLEGFPLHCCQVLDHIVISPHSLSIEGP